jgi:hypothetical protein
MDKATYSELVRFLSLNNSQKWPEKIGQIKNKKKRASKKSKFREQARCFVLFEGKLHRKCSTKVIQIEQNENGKFCVF